MLKIGILIKDFNQLQNWELRIIENIKNDPDLELTLLIKDGRVKNHHKTPKKSFTNFLFNKQVLFEKKRYLKNIQTTNKADIFRYLDTIPTIEVKPKRDGDVDIFSIDDSQKTKGYNLDVILKHGFNIISGEILNIAKHGIWLLAYGKNLQNADPPGFLEVLNKEPVVEVSLRQLCSEIWEGKGKVIDKAYFNRHIFSYVLTNNLVLESSVTFLFKNINKLKNKENILSETIVNLKPFKTSPSSKNTVKYIYNFIKIFITGRFEGFFANSGKRKDNWLLFFGSGNFMDSDLSKLKPIIVPDDEFWADPFLFKHKSQLYVFFEKYSYKTKKGIISCGLIKDNELIDIVDVLDLDYHLSYPFIFKEDGEIFMMPETSENKRLEIYKCISFPNQWELYATAFNGERVFDAFFYNDKQKQKWLYINKKATSVSDNASELYIYKVDSVKLNKLESHKQNPVIIDARVARNGGAIFNYKNKIYRPSQSNTDGIYGKALNINQIEKLTLNEYLEKTIRRVEPNFKNEFFKIHHLHQIDGMFVFDAAKKYM